MFQSERNEKIIANVVVNANTRSLIRVKLENNCVKQGFSIGVVATPTVLFTPWFKYTV